MLTSQWKQTASASSLAIDHVEIPRDPVILPRAVVWYSAHFVKMANGLRPNSAKKFFAISSLNSFAIARSFSAYSLQEIVATSRVFAWNATFSWVEAVYSSYTMPA